MPSTKRESSSTSKSAMSDSAVAVTPAASPLPSPPGSTAKGTLLVVLVLPDRDEALEDVSMSTAPMELILRY